MRIAVRTAYSPRPNGHAVWRSDPLDPSDFARRIREVRTTTLLLTLLMVACGHSSTYSTRTSKDDAAADRGAPVAVPTPKGEVRYLALGDSFTIGTGATPEQSFPARWAARWGDRCLSSVRNVAVNGFTTQDLIDRELPALAEVHPKWASVAIGANDIVAGAGQEDYRARVKTILAAVLAAGVAPEHLIVVPQPDWSLSPQGALFGAPAVIAARIETFNGILAQEAKAVGARFVDLFPLMRREALAGMIASDGLHPSASAYDEWGAELGKQLASPCD
jgi:acyl-CoA thioesterase-1